MACSGTSGLCETFLPSGHHRRRATGSWWADDVLDDPVFPEMSQYRRLRQGKHKRNSERNRINSIINTKDFAIWKWRSTRRKRRVYNTQREAPTALTHFCSVGFPPLGAAAPSPRIEKAKLCICLFHNHNNMHRTMSWVDIGGVFAVTSTPCGTT